MNTILFPFKIDQDNKAAYVKAMNVAKQKGAKVILFTTLSSSSAAEKDKAYFHLLALHGYYQTTYNNWQAASKVTTERVFEFGNFDIALKTLLASQAIDWIVPTAAVKAQFSAHQGPVQISTLVESTRPYYPHLALEN